MAELAKKEVKNFTVEDAALLAQEIDRYDAALKAMKNKLKAFVEINGAVEANGKVWDFQPSSSWSFEPEQLKVLAGMIVFDKKDPFEFLTLSATAIKKLKWSDEVLSHYGEKKAGTSSFRAVKIENYKK
jgi:hypothetical protein